MLLISVKYAIDFSERAHWKRVYGKGLSEVIEGEKWEETQVILF